jgi:hypothetical protein
LKEQEKKRDEKQLSNVSTSVHVPTAAAVALQL